MGKADRRVCVGSDRCGRGGRESWDVWLEVRTGLVKLVAQAEA